MLRPNTNTDDVSHDPFPARQGIDDSQLPGRVDWSVSFEYGIQSLVRINLEELLTRVGNSRRCCTRLRIKLVTCPARSGTDLPRLFQPVITEDFSIIRARALLISLIRSLWHSLNRRSTIHA